MHDDERITLPAAVERYQLTPGEQKQVKRALRRAIYSHTRKRVALYRRVEVEYVLARLRRPARAA
jgi:hypothetical protein